MHARMSALRIPFDGRWPRVLLGLRLIGLAAMHGFAPHGVSGHVSGSTTPASLGSLHDTDAMTTRGGQQSVSVLGADSQSRGHAPDDAPPGVGLLEVCVAVLFVVGGLALAARAGPTLLSALRRTGMRPAPGRRYPTADPPSLAQLAVLRC